METSFIDSRRNAALTANFNPSTVTIQEYADGVDGYGAPTQTWGDLAGHVDLPCSISLSSGKETKLADQEYGVTTHRIALNGVYPTITRLHRAIVDGTTYEIQYATPPGHANSITVLLCSIASGGV
jgi:head-tail adaptor